MNTKPSLLIALIVFASSFSFGQAQIQEKELEYTVLKELQLDLTQNLDDINSNIEALKLSGKANRMIVNVMENNLPYNDSLDFYFGNLYPYLVFSPNETTFNFVKQKGMSLISNDSLRLAVSDL